MQKVLLCILLLSMGVSLANANISDINVTRGPTYQFTTTTPIQDRITKKDHQICINRARVSAAAFNNGKLHNMTLESQLEQWDAFSLSSKAEHIDVNELLTIRELIVLAFTAMDKFPELSYLDFGDFVYAECIQEKTSILAKK